MPASSPFDPPARAAELSGHRHVLLMEADAVNSEACLFKLSSFSELMCSLRNRNRLSLGTRAVACASKRRVLLAAPRAHNPLLLQASVAFRRLARVARESGCRNFTVFRVFLGDAYQVLNQRLSRTLVSPFCAQEMRTVAGHSYSLRERFESRKEVEVLIDAKVRVPSL